VRAAYLTAADTVIDAYRHSDDPAPQHFDWRAAQASLERALELDRVDRVARGKLALVRGYLDLLARARQPARQHFEEAAASLPQSPDPHLGLARLYVYSYPDLERARAEFYAASKLGYRLGPREMAQEADAWRFRALRELKSHPELARRDLTLAWHLYNGAHDVPGVGTRMRQVEAAYEQSMSPRPPRKAASHARRKPAWR
jgi:hypothetical protein